MRYAFFATTACLVACGSSSPFEVSLVYQLRCDVAGGCVQPPSRRLVGEDATPGFNLQCSVTRSGEQATLQALAFFGTEYGVEIERAAFDFDSGELARGDCRIQVQEDLSYQGACGPDTPSAAQPCRVGPIDLTEPGLIRIPLLCIGLPAQSAPNRVREVTDPDDSGTAALLQYARCEGT